MSNTHAIDLTHFPDDASELAAMSAAVRELGGFLVAIINAVTRVYPTVGHDLGIPCLKRDCKGSIQASLETLDGKITWGCLICEQYGIICNWRGTKWDQTGKAGTGSTQAATYTPKQGQYLAFIDHYTKLNGRAPAIIDLRKYFHVSPPAVNEMIVRLEKHGFISREPGKPRSIRLVLEREELPDLE